MRIPGWHWRSASETCSIRLADTSHKIFTSEEGELPPQHVINFLESLNPRHCARYLEFIIKDRHEASPIYHDRLAKLFLKMTLDAKQVGDEGMDIPNALDQNVPLICLPP
jgi:hypothetical protein